MDGCMDGWMNGWMNGWKSGWMEGWLQVGLRGRRKESSVSPDYWRRKEGGGTPQQEGTGLTLKIISRASQPGTFLQILFPPGTPDFLLVPSQSLGHVSHCLALELCVATLCFLKVIPKIADPDGLGRARYRQLCQTQVTSQTHCHRLYPSHPQGCS